MKDEIKINSEVQTLSLNLFIYGTQGQSITQNITWVSKQRNFSTKQEIREHFWLDMMIIVWVDIIKSCKLRSMIGKKMKKKKQLTERKLDKFNSGLTEPALLGSLLNSPQL